MIYLVKDELQEYDLSEVHRIINITPPIGSIVLTAKAIKIAQELSLDYLPMLAQSLDEATVVATTVAESSDLPMVIIGDFAEKLQEIGEFHVSADGQ